MDVVSIAPYGNAVLTGRTSVISCILQNTHDGSNPITSLWFQGNTPITTGASTDYSTADKKAILEVSGVSSDQVFTCRFKLTGEASIESTVNLDFITVTPTHDIVSSGKTATVTCVLSGATSAPAIFKWHLHGGDITNGGDYTFYTYPAYSGGSQTDILQISGLTESKEFECGYTFTTECIKTIAKVDFISLTPSDVDISIITGTSITASCDIASSPSNPTDIIWKTDGGVLINGKSGVTIDTGNFDNGARKTTLEIAANTITVDITYTCEFIVGSVTVKEKINVDVTTITATSDTTLNGGSVVLSCELTGADAEPSLITWRKTGSNTDVVSGDGTNIITADNWESSSGTKVSKLAVTGLTTTTPYICKFTVNGDELTQTVTATVIDIQTTGTTLQDGMTGSVTCTISNTNVEPSMIIWKDDEGQSIKTGQDSYTILNELYSGGSQLSILGLSTTKDSTFTCVFVVNGKGYTKTVSVDHVAVESISDYKLSADQAVVTCVLSGAGSTPTVAWLDSTGVTKNTGGGLTVDPGSAPVNGGVTTKLTSTIAMTNVKYTCRFIFANVNVDNGVDINVVDIVGTDSYVQESETATITCTLSLSPKKPSVNVWKDSKESPIQTGGKYFSDLGKFDTSSNIQVMKLEVSSVSENLEFTCLFTIEGRDIIGKAKVGIVKVDTMSAVIQTGEKAVISCEIQGAPSKPDYIIWKNSDGGTLSDDDAYNKIEYRSWNEQDNSQSTSLEVTGLTTDVTYTCEYVVDLSTIKGTPTIDVVEIQVGNTYYQNGDTATFSCALTASETAPTIAWKRGVTPITSGVDDGTWEPDTGAQTTVLEIASISTNDKVTCVFTINKVEDASEVTGTLLTITATGTPVTIGMTTTVTCSVTGLSIAPSNVRWKQGETTLANNVGGAVFDATGSWKNNIQENILEYTGMTDDTSFTCLFSVNGLSHEKSITVDFVTIGKTNKSIKENAATATVGCAMTGNIKTPTLITWTGSIDGEVTHNQGGYSIAPTTVGGTDSSLTITTSTSVDQIFTCKYTLDGTLLSQTVTLDTVTVSVTNAIIQSGDTTSLTCILSTSQNNPKSITWKVDNVPVTDGTGNVKIVTGDYLNESKESALEKTDITTDKTVNCEFVFINGDVVSSELSVDVVAIAVTSALIDAGETATLSCVLSGIDVSGNSLSSAIWKNSNDVEIVTETGITVTKDIAGIELLHTSLTTDTTYTCVYTISYAVVSQIAVVDFVTIATTISHSIITPDMTTTITCTVAGSASKPSDVVWSIEGSSVTHNMGGATIDKGQYLNEGQKSTLTIAADSISDDTTYTCTFTISSENLAAVQLVDVITIEMLGAVSVTSQTVTLTCKITSATTDPVIGWKGITQGITENQFDNNEKKSELVVSGIVTDTDYTCTVSVGTLTAEKVGKLDIVTWTPKGAMTLGNDPTTITCVLGDADFEPSSVQWSNDITNPITDATPYTIEKTSFENNSQYHKLIIATVSEDTTFTCKATFTAGSTVVTTEVSLDKIEILATGFTLLSSETASLTCTLTGAKTDPTTIAWSTTEGVLSNNQNGVTIGEGSYNNVTETRIITIEKTGITEDTPFTCSFIHDKIFKKTITADVFSLTLSSDTIQTGETATLICALSNLITEPSNVAWKINGSPVDSSSHKESNWDGNAGTISSTLEKSGITADDKVTCDFTVSSQTIRGNLEVNFVEVEVKRPLYQSDGIAIFSCTLRKSKITPIVSWKNNNSKKVSNSNTVTIDEGTWNEQDGEQTTTLTKTGMTKSETYICVYTIENQEIANSVSGTMITITATASPVTTGMTSKISCSLAGSTIKPTLVSWKKDGVAASNNNDGVSGIDDGEWNNDIQLNNIEVTGITEDTPFTCIFTINAVDHEISVIADFVTIDKTSKTIKENAATATVGCAMTGNIKTPTLITWTGSIDGEVTHNQGGYSIAPTTAGGTDSSLTITTSTSVDQTFTCKYTLDGILLSQTVTLDTVTVVVKNSIIQSGETATMACDLSGSENNPSTITWKKAGNSLTHDVPSGVVLIDEGIFKDGSRKTTLSYTEITQDTVFSCDFVFTNGDTISSALDVDVVVITVTDALIGASTPASLGCNLSSNTVTNSITSAVWKDIENVQVQNGNGITVTENLASISLTHTSLSLDTTYTCVYTMKGLTTSKSVPVDIVTIALTASKTIITSDMGTALTCSISGAASKPSSVKWTSGNSDVIHEQGVKTIDEGLYENEQQKTTLTIAAGNIKSDTTYTCKFNIRSATIKAELLIDVVNIVVKGVVARASQTTTLTCIVNSATTDPTITWKDVSQGITANQFDNNEKKSELEVSTVTTDKEYTCMVTVDSLTTAKTGKLDIITWNPVGSGTFGNTPTIITCILGDADEEPSKVEWFDGSSNPIVDGTPYTIEKTTFNNNGQDQKLTIATLSQDTSFTCKATFTDGSSVVTAEILADKVEITSKGFAFKTGETATLTCTLTGAKTDPTAVYWSTSQGILTDSRTGVSIDEGSHDANAETRTITLEVASLAQDTTFTCSFTMTKALTKTVKAYFVDITASPSNAVQSGGAVTLTCSATVSVSTATITWTDGTNYWDSSTTGTAVLFDSPAYSNGKVSSTLIVTTVDTNKLYTCTVTFDKYTVNAIPSQIYAVNVEFKTSYGVKDDALILTCQFTDDTIAATSITFQQQDNNGDLVESSHNAGTITTSSPYTNTLTINAFTASDETFYVCVITTSIFTYETSKKYIEMLAIIQAPSSVNILTGNTVTLLGAFANPAAFTGSKTVTWYKNNNRITTSSDIETKIDVKPGKSALILAGIDYTDSGGYKFKIMYESVGEVTSAEATVNVRGIITNPSTVSQYSGYDTILTCVMRGEQQADINYYFSGKKLASQPTETYVDLQTTSKLTITVTATTSGVYHCEGNFGDDVLVVSATATVSVKSSCVRGQYLDSSDFVCKLCNKGDYSDNPGLTACIACPESRSTTFTGSTSVTQCYGLTAAYTAVGVTGSAIKMETFISTSDTVSSVSWTKDGTLVSSGTSSTLLGSITTATLIDASFTAVNYICTFNMARNSDIETLTVTITGYAAPIIDVPVAAPQTAGAVYTLTCSGTLPPPGISYSSGWLQDGEPVDAVLSVVDRQDNTKVTSELRFDYLRSGMTGDYSCFFKHGDYVVKSDTTYLMVSGITSFPAQYIAIEGGNAYITCVGISSTASEETKWYHKGAVMSEIAGTRTILNTQTLSESVYTSKSVLGWNSLTESEEGELQCSMRFSGSWITSDVGNLVVFNIISPPQDFSSVKEQEAKVACIADGPPIPKLQWYKSNILLDISMTSVDVSISGDRFISTLTFPNSGKSDEGLYKCKATWLDAEGIKGGSITSGPATFTTYGISYITPSTSIAKGSQLIVTCKVDFFLTPTVRWYENGLSITGSQGLIQTDATTMTDTYVVTGRTVGSITKYACSVVYTDSNGNVYQGPSPNKEMEISVYQNCPTLNNPMGGRLVCAGVDTDKTCTVICNSGYVGRIVPRTFKCSGGLWDLVPNNAECSQTATPSSRTLDHKVAYAIPIVCTITPGPYIAASYPYYLKGGESQFTYVPGTLQIVADSFKCINEPTGCSTPADCTEFIMEFKYIQTKSLDTDLTGTTSTELSTYIAQNGFDSTALLTANNRLNSDGNLIGAFTGRRKRSSGTTPKFSINSTYYIDPTMLVQSEDGRASRNYFTHSKVNCPEYTVTLTEKCVVCSVGYVIIENSCEPCPRGTFQNIKESNECSVCPEGTSTLSEGTISIDMCVEVCLVEKPAYGTVYPKENTILSKNHEVTVVCDDQFSYHGKQSVVVPCSMNVSCSKIELIGVPQYVIQHTNVKFSCHIQSVLFTPQDNCTWYSGSEIVGDTSPQFDIDLAICTLDKFVETDMDISCSVNLAGEKIESEKYKVTYLEPKVIALSQYVRKTESINLVCSAVVPYGFTAIIQWNKNGNKVGKIRYTRQYLSVFEYIIDQSKFEDSGNYTCSVEYITIGISLSKPVPIFVLGLIQGLSSMTLATGSQTTLTCIYPTYNMESAVTWYQNSSKVTAYQLNEYDNIKISTIFVDQAAVYNCSYQLGDLIFSSVAVVKISAEGFKNHPTSHNVVTGDNIKLTCELNSYNINNEIKWVKNGKVIDSGTNTISLVDIQDSCIVWCSYLTSQGKVIKSNIAHISVRKIISQPTNVVVINDGIAVFFCSVSGINITTMYWETNTEEILPTSSLVATTPLLTQATLELNNDESVRCVVEFDNNSVVKSTWAKAIPYKARVSKTFALLNHGALVSCLVSAPIRPSEVLFQIDKRIISKENNVIYDQYTESSETSYYFTSLDDIAIKEVICTAVFDSLVVTSPQRSIAPLGIITSPRDKRNIQSEFDEVEFTCEFYDYPEIKSEISWHTVPQKQLKTSSNYVDENTVQSTVVLSTDKAGKFTIQCSVNYPGYGRVTSAFSSLIILKPLTLTTFPLYVGYGDVVEATATIPRLTGDDKIVWQVDDIIMWGQTKFINDTHFISKLKWPLSKDSIIKVVAKCSGHVQKKSVNVTVYGIEYVSVDGEVKIGGSVNLTCVINKSGKISKTFWYKKSTSIEATRVTNTEHRTISILELNDIQTDDLGKYYCLSRYLNRHPVFKSIKVIPTKACDLPEIANGNFNKEFIENGESILPSCFESRLLSLSTTPLTCEDGEIVGIVPVCEEVSSLISHIPIFVACACIAVVCLLSVTAVLVYNKYKRVATNDYAQKKHDQAFYDDDEINLPKVSCTS